MAAPDEPFSREEGYYDAILGNPSSMPDYPMSRKEQYLEAIALNGGGGGGGGTLNYEELFHKPKINNVELTGNKTLANIGAQAKLTSGSNIKTINGKTVLGSGDLELDAGDIMSENDLSVQDNIDAIYTDLDRIEDDKQNKLTAGSNITIVNDVISATGGGAVNSVNSKTGTVVLDATDIKLTTNQQTIQANLIRIDEEAGRLEDDKQDKLTAGAGIVISENNVISSTGGVTPEGLDEIIDGDGEITVDLSEDNDKLIIGTHAKTVEITGVPATATSGTLTEQQLAALLESKDSVIVFNNEIYTLNDNGHETGIKGYSHSGVENNVFMLKNITVTLNTRGWVLTTQEVGQGSTESTNAWKNKIISIMGDSISTYSGYIPQTNDGHNLSHVAYYPRSTFNDVTKTWWYSLIDDLGAKLGVNESWSGSYVGNTSDSEIVTGGNNYGTKCAMASNTRVENLGSNGYPDLILVYGGTNDIWSGASRMGETVPGTFDSSAVHDLTPSTLLNTHKWNSFAEAFRDMLLKMMYYYPTARIVVLFPFYADSSSAYSHAKLDEFIEVQRNICDYFGVNYIDLRACGINVGNNASSKNIEGISNILTQNVHPNYDGMKLMKDYIKARLLSLFDTDRAASVVYSVTNNLSTNVNADRYIKSVKSGKYYKATITGSALATVNVYMGGQDVTSSVYNSSTGKINIANCTGDIVISEGQVTVYTVTTNVTNGSKTGATSIVSGGTATVTISANTGYKLPMSVSVSGATHTYNQSTGVVSLSNPTGNVTITANCVAVTTYSITVTPTNGTYTGDTSIIEDGSATVTLSANFGYKLPNTITVSGATHTYSQTTGVVSLSNPTGNVTIQFTCVAVPTYTITTTVSNGTFYGDTSITEDGTATVYLSANTGYDLPEEITVTGAEYTYDNTNGSVELSGPTANVTIDAVCTSGIVWYSSNYNANTLNKSANLSYAGFAYCDGVHDEDGTPMNRVRFVLNTPGKITFGKCSADFKTIVASEQITVSGASGDTKVVELANTYVLENGEHFFINAPSVDTGLFKYSDRSAPATQGDRKFMVKVGTSAPAQNASSDATAMQECISVDFGYYG